MVQSAITLQREALEAISRENLCSVWLSLQCYKLMKTAHWAGVTEKQECGVMIRQGCLRFPEKRITQLLRHTYGLTFMVETQALYPTKRYISHALVGIHMYEKKRIANTNRQKNLAAVMFLYGMAVSNGHTFKAVYNPFDLVNSRTWPADKELFHTCNS